MSTAGAPPEPLVIFVDDDEANRRVFALTFGTRFRTQVAASGQEALELIEKELPAVVVSDQRMPGMVGTELLARVAERSPDTVRVMLTAYNDPEPMLQAINTAAVARYLVKPWDAKEMNAVLAGAIDTYQLATQKRVLELQLVESHRLGALGMLSATIAHDMASPLSAIVVNLERLRQHGQTLVRLRERLGRRADWSDAERDALAELPEIAEEVVQSASYLTDLVSGMRTTVRAGSAATTCTPRVVVSLATTLARGVATERGGRMSMGRCTSTPVKISSQQLMQVLLNLVTNAAQSLNRSLLERVVQVEAMDAPGGVEFTVRDTGQGMTPEQVAKAGQVRFTTKDEGQGTGLGLTIVRKIIEGAGGEIGYASEPGKGTTVTFTVPRA